MTDWITQHLSLSVEWPAGARPPAWNLARTRDMAKALAQVHPLFAELSPRGRGGSFETMEAMPLVDDLTVEQWLDLARLHGRRSDADPGTTIVFWNRRRAEGEAQLVEIHYDQPGGPAHPRLPRRPNEIRFPALPPQMQARNTILSLIGACIDAFDAHRADVAWLMQAPVRPMEPARSTLAYRLLWLGENVAFPEDAETRYRYPADHPEPEGSDPWRGGTLYRWPDADLEASIR